MKATYNSSSSEPNSRERHLACLHILGVIGQLKSKEDVQGQSEVRCLLTLKPSLFLNDGEIGRAVADIRNSRIADGHAAASIVTDPQGVPRVRSESVVGDVYVLEAHIAKRALSLLAAGRHDGESVGHAVLDVHIADDEPRNTAAVVAHSRANWITVSRLTPVYASCQAGENGKLSSS